MAARKRGYVFLTGLVARDGSKRKVDYENYRS